MEHLMLNRDGMHCGVCATGIHALLLATERVTFAGVLYGSKKREAVFDPEKGTKEKIIARDRRARIPSRCGAVAWL